MSSGFITESELEIIRNKKQEEWDKVRKPNDPVERPEEPFDSRSLFDRLQEQKQKKTLEYEEAHKLKNMIKGLDDDEIEFLDLVDRKKMTVERMKELEETAELNDFKRKMAHLQQKDIDEKVHENVILSKPKSSSNACVSQQQKLLKNAVLTKKRKFSSEPSEKECAPKIQALAPQGALEYIGILPGLGCYNESSDDGNSTDSEIEASPGKMDLLGRKIKIEAASKET